MAVYQDFEDLLQCLNTARARYLLVGAHAVAIYTEPRYTKDMGVWVEPTKANAARVYKALQKFGAPMTGLTIKDLCDPEKIYQIGVEPVRIDIIMGLPRLNFARAWKNKTTTRFGKIKTFVLAREDLIKAKGSTKRPQDKIDLQKMLKVGRIKKKTPTIRYRESLQD